MPRHTKFRRPDETKEQHEARLVADKMAKRLAKEERRVAKRLAKEERHKAEREALLQRPDETKEQHEARTKAAFAGKMASSKRADQARRKAVKEAKILAKRATAASPLPDGVPLFIPPQMPPFMQPQMPPFPSPQMLLPLAESCPYDPPSESSVECFRQGAPRLAGNVAWQKAIIATPALLDQEGKEPLGMKIEGPFGMIQFAAGKCTRRRVVVRNCTAFDYEVEEVLVLPGNLGGSFRVERLENTSFACAKDCAEAVCDGSKAREALTCEEASGKPGGQLLGAVCSAKQNTFFGLTHICGNEATKLHEVTRAIVVFVLRKVICCSVELQIPAGVRPGEQWVQSLPHGKILVRCPHHDVSTQRVRVNVKVPGAGGIEAVHPTTFRAIEGVVIGCSVEVLLVESALASSDLSTSARPFVPRQLRAVFEFGMAGYRGKGFLASHNPTAYPNFPKVVDRSEQTLACLFAKLYRGRASSRGNPCMAEDYVQHLTRVLMCELETQREGMKAFDMCVFIQYSSDDDPNTSRYLPLAQTH